MSTQSLHELESLRTQVTSLKAQNGRLEAQNVLYAEEAERLREILLAIKRQIFGTKKERWESQEQSRLQFNEVESVNAPEKVTAVEVSGFTRVRGKRSPLPLGLPREIVLVELPSDERFSENGEPLRVIGKEVSEKLFYEPATIKVIEYHRCRYGVDSGETLKTAPPVPAIIPKGIATPSLLSAIVTGKYGDGLPLYRLEEIFARANVDIPRCSMARWVVQAAEACMPVWNALEERLLASGYVACDETPVQVLKEPGRKAESKSWMWVRGTPAEAQKIVFFDYDTSRSGAVAKRLMAGLRGFIQADGLPVYGIFEKQEGITRVGCNMHGRRGFDKALRNGAKAGRPLAEEALGFYQILYEIEDEARVRGLTWPERHALRLGKSRFVWKKMKTWAETHAPTVPPKSQIGHALRYFLGEYEHLTAYLRDGCLEIDNGFVERMIRKFAIGRNNWLFSDIQAGASASAMFYSFVVTAKANGLDPFRVLSQVFERVPLAQTAENYDAIAALLLGPII
jgi:transposase